MDVQWNVRWARALSVCPSMATDCAGPLAGPYHVTTGQKRSVYLGISWNSTKCACQVAKLVNLDRQSRNSTTISRTKIAEQRPPLWENRPPLTNSPPFRFSNQLEIDRLLCICNQFNKFSIAARALFVDLFMLSKNITYTFCFRTFSYKKAAP